MDYCRSASFQVLVSGSIMVDIVTSSEASKLQGTTFDGKSPGIQLSQNKRIVFPSPILHSIHLSMTCLALSMLHQAKDPLELFASRTGPVGNYLVLNTLKKSDDLSMTSLQTCLASIASLNLTKSLKPNPPSSLCLHNDSQFLQ